MNTPFLPYAKQSISEEDREAVSLSLKNQRITRGEKTEEFEAAIASYCDARFAVCFSNATCGLYAAFFAADVGPEDYFLVPPNTYIATAGAGIRAGAIPHYIDIDRNSGNMDLDKFKELVEKPKSRGKYVVAPVHFSGIAIDMHKLDRSFVAAADICVIEDAAHAIGSIYPTGEKVGSCVKSAMTVFSFHPAKTITCGEGGAVTTNSEELMHKLKMFRNNGIERESKYLKNGVEEPGYYESQAITGNFHMTEMQAALGLSQFKRLDSFVQKRRSLVACYRKYLEKEKLIRLFSSEYDELSGYHLFIAQIDFESLGTTRSKVMKELYDAGIGTEYHYIPIYRHPVIGMSHLADRFPEMERYYKQALSLPLYYDLREEDVERVAATLKKILSGKKR